MTYSRTQVKNFPWIANERSDPHQGLHQIRNVQIIPPGSGIKKINLVLSQLPQDLGNQKVSTLTWTIQIKTPKNNYSHPEIFMEETANFFS